MKNSKGTRKVNGILKTLNDKKVYQICEMSINKTELVLGVFSPTVLELV
tara:strand:+ start:7183 stop:7329 length:147 start_codon:yes stop_codon:yes gene_type:complete